MPQVEINGQSVFFKQMPTPEDIDHVAASLKVQPDKPEPELRAAPTIAQRVSREALPQGAAIAGSLVAGTPGAMVGGGVGRAAETLREGGTPKEALVSGAEEAAGQGAAGLALRAVGGAIKRILPTSDVTARTAQEFFKKYRAGAGLKPYAPIMSPAASMAEDAPGRYGWQLFENLGKASILDLGHVASIEKNRNLLANAAREDMIESFASVATPKDVGEAVQTAIGDERVAAEAVTQPLYKAFEDRVTPKDGFTTQTKQVATGVLDAKGNPVFRTVQEQVPAKVGGIWGTITDAKKFAQPIREIADAVGGVDPGTTGESLARTITAADTRVSVDQMSMLRSSLLALKRRASATDVVSSKTHLISGLVSKVDHAIESTLSAQDPEALTMWRTANRLTKENAEQLRNEVVSGLMQLGTRYDTQGVGTILDRVMKPGDGFPAGQLMTAIRGHPETSAMVQRGFAEKLMREAEDSSGVLDGTKFRTLLEKSTKDGYADSITHVYSDAQRKGMLDFAKAVETVQRPGPGGVPGASGSMLMFAQKSALIRVTQSSLAGGTLYAGIKTGHPKAGATASATILLAPALMARMVASPITARLMARAVRLPADTRMAQNVGARIIAAAGAELVAEHRERAAARDAEAARAVSGSPAGGAFVGAGAQ